MHELAMTSETAFLLLLANVYLISAVPIARARNKHFEDGYKMQPVIVTPQADFCSGASPALLKASFHRLLNSSL
jgi:hypothetical protein